MKEQIKLTDAERQPCEVWSRVMGYHRPTNSWNIGKKMEYKDRKPFRQPTEEELAVCRTETQPGKEQ